MNRINKYTCNRCDGTIITIDKDKGTTPFLIACRAREGCKGTMQSHFYGVYQKLNPEYEWYKPTQKEIMGLFPDADERREVKSHVRKGSLILRKIGELK